MTTLPDPSNTPRTVPWSAVADFDHLDERVSAVTTVFGSVIGVNDGSVEWCPDDDPPTEQERLAWLWLCNPSLAPEILPRAQGEFHDLVIAYRDGRMSQWWADTAGPNPPIQPSFLARPFYRDWVLAYSLVGVGFLLSAPPRPILPAPTGYLLLACGVVIFLTAAFHAFGRLWRRPRG